MKDALRKFNRPFHVMAIPFRATRVGYTQSNISTPRATPSTKQSAVPTPIK